MRLSSLGLNLDGKVAIITGAARGIGQQIAIGLARAGADEFLVDINPEVQIVCEKVQKLGKRAVPFSGDVSQLHDVKAAVESCLKEFGKISILINNAAISTPALVNQLTNENWDKTISINLTGVFYFCREVIPHFMEQKSGKILNMSSVNAQFGGKETAHYCAAKGGVESFSKTLARELGPYHINVNVIAPGYIETDMMRLMPERQKRSIIKRIPLGRIGKPEDIVGSALLLVSDAGKYITGQVVNVNGGFFMG